MDKYQWDVLRRLLESILSELKAKNPRDPGLPCENPRYCGRTGMYGYSKCCAPQMSTGTGSFLLELRTAASRCTKTEYRDALREAATSVAKAFDTVAFTMSTEDMRVLVGRWTVAAVMLKGVPPEAEPNAPLAGAPEAARLAA